MRRDQLRSDAQAVAASAYAAFEHVAHTEFAPDLFHVDPIGKARTNATSRWTRWSRLSLQLPNIREIKRTEAS
jgi:hypothetical protein